MPTENGSSRLPDTNCSSKLLEPRRWLQLHSVEGEYFCRDELLHSRGIFGKVRQKGGASNYHNLGVYLGSGYFGTFQCIYTISAT